MGVRFECPNGHKLHVKAHLAGERGICPHCDSRFIVPAASDQPKLVATPAPEEKEAEEPLVDSIEVSLPIDTSITLPKSHRNSRRSRRERARRLTLILTAVIFALAIALIVILR